MARKSAEHSQELLIKNLQQLAELAKQLKIEVKTPSLILLEGTLGTGKTAFTKKFLNLYGLDESKVKSPTFSLVNLYKQNDYLLAHLDLYRLDQHDQFLLEEIKEIIQNPNSITIIEWPEKMNLEPLFPLVKQIINIKIEFTEKDFRKFHIYVKNQ